MSRTRRASGPRESDILFLQAYFLKKASSRRVSAAFRRARPLFRAGFVLAACLWLALDARIPGPDAAWASLHELAERSGVLEAGSWPLAMAPSPAGFFTQDVPSPLPFRPVFAGREAPRGAGPSAQRMGHASGALYGAPSGGDIAFTRRVIRTLSPLCRLAWG